MQCDYEELMDKVTAALECGNEAAAREAIATVAGEYPDLAFRVKLEAEADYGVRL